MSRHAREKDRLIPAPLALADGSTHFVAPQCCGRHRYPEEFSYDGANHGDWTTLAPGQLFIYTYTDSGAVVFRCTERGPHAIEGKGYATVALLEEVPQFPPGSRPRRVTVAWALDESPASSSRRDAALAKGPW